MNIYVDSDSHVLEPNQIATEYVVAKYRELVPQVVEREGIAYIRSRDGYSTNYRLQPPAFRTA